MRSGEDKGFASTLTTRPGSPMKVRKGREIEDGGIKGDDGDGDGGGEEDSVRGDLERQPEKDESEVKLKQIYKKETPSATSDIAISWLTAAHGITETPITSSKAISDVTAKDPQTNGDQTRERRNNEEDEVATGSPCKFYHITPLLIF
jgi:hypothetical protein